MHNLILNALCEHYAKIFMYVNCFTFHSKPKKNNILKLSTVSTKWQDSVNYYTSTLLSMKILSKTVSPTHMWVT